MSSPLSDRPNRYYKLEHEFFMSGSSRALVEIMSRNNLWVRVLSSSQEPESRKALPDRLDRASQKLQHSMSEKEANVFGGRNAQNRFREQSQAQIAETRAALEESAKRSSASSTQPLLSSETPRLNQELADGNVLASEACLEFLAAQTTQLAKNLLFNNNPAARAEAMQEE